MCVKDTGTKYQLWISDFNIDGTFTRVHPLLLLGGDATGGSWAGSGYFNSSWVRSASHASVGFFTTVKLD